MNGSFTLNKKMYTLKIFLIYSIFSVIINKTKYMNFEKKNPKIILADMMAGTIQSKTIE